MDARAKHGVSPFQLAVWQNHLSICKWLVSGPRSLQKFSKYNNKYFQGSYTGIILPIYLL